ncbi:MAG: polysaccharide biosynthesis protein [Bacteroidales bacterium]|nr:polysaccharide biosynthesis protein [Bacteroidales bacterium]
MDNLFSKLNRYVNRYLSTKIVFLLDMVMAVCASSAILFLINLFVDVELLRLRPVIVWIAGSAFFSFFFIWAFRTYRIIIRHMTLRDLGRFMLVALCKSVLLVALYGIVFGFGTLVFVMGVGDFLLTTLAFLLLRVVMLVVYDMVKNRMEYRKKCMNVLIFGVGDKSVALVGRLQTSTHYKIVGFLQHGGDTHNYMISEKPVYKADSEAEFSDMVDAHDIDAILFATKNDAYAEKETLIQYAIDKGVKVLFAPTIDEMVDGKVSHQVRNIDIEDLLMRDEIKISMDEIVQNFRGKTIMVTGAAGSIGSELCRQLATFGVKELVLFDNAETPMHNLRLELEEKFPELSFVPVIGDVRLLPRLDYAFRKWRPQVVFHAAAYKHVPLMEENPCEAVLVNVAGSRNVADKCIEYEVEKMVMISTDKAVNPTNMMGCTKRLAEIYVQSLGLAMEQGLKSGKTKFVTTRFGNVLGSNGSVIPRFRDQIAKGGPLTVTHPDITRFFMTIPEACRLVMEAATMSTGNQIFVFDMGESVKIDDLARRMIKLAGFTPDKDIKIEYSGLRPGEKLYEEVLSNNENTIPTDHSRIRIAKVRSHDYADAAVTVDQLEHLSREVNIPDMVRLMKKTVPEFISKNSRFEIYDKEKETSAAGVTAS